MSDYTPPYSGNITRLVNILEANGIKSREDLMTRFDVDASAKQYEAIKGIGPRLARLLVQLRGMSIDDWVRYTGKPAFNHSKE